METIITEKAVKIETVNMDNSQPGSESSSASESQISGSTLPLLPPLPITGFLPPLPSLHLQEFPSSFPGLLSEPSSSLPASISSSSSASSSLSASTSLGDTLVPAPSTTPNIPGPDDLYVPTGCGGGKTWLSFRRLKSDDTRIFCVECNVFFTFRENHGTSNYVRHIRNKHPHLLDEIEGKDKEKQKPKERKSDKKSIRDSQDGRILQQVVGMEGEDPTTAEHTLIQDHSDQKEGYFDDQEWTDESKGNADDRGLESQNNNLEGHENPIPATSSSSPSDAPKEEDLYIPSSSSGGKIWLAFRRIRSDPNRIWCIECRVHFLYQATHGTSNYVRHIRTKHPHLLESENIKVKSEIDGDQFPEDHKQSPGSLKKRKRKGMSEAGSGGKRFKDYPDVFSAEVKMELDTLLVKWMVEFAIPPNALLSSELLKEFLARVSSYRYSLPPEDQLNHILTREIPMQNQPPSQVVQEFPGPHLEERP